jgi:hypothetical protein
MPFKTPEQKAEHNKLYYLKNKERMAIYYQTNKEEINKKQKEYYQRIHKTKMEQKDINKDLNNK